MTDLWGVENCGGGVQTGEAGGQRWGLEWTITESDPCSTPHKQHTLTGLRASSAEIFI